ncbi:outer membrane protein assembly factor BamC [Fodinibius saliphilus]|uniref:outer membrane protein assembly factor BamC n=1 Tax=Fodinibius saliphilus TaxID=1920650 RepID=UPI001109E778|nr:outer membrane protein assembly factor BamC [Fodinibius saliphilus]
MKSIIINLLIAVFLMVSCAGSGSVYQLPDNQQKGLTFQTYQESPEQAFDVVKEEVKNYKSKMLIQDGWEITSSNKKAGTIKTDWRQAGSSASVSGGRTMGSDSDERYKLSVRVIEVDSGSKVSIQLIKQVKMSQWRTFDVKKKTAQKHIQPILKNIESKLTVQG